MRGFWTLCLLLLAGCGRTAIEAQTHSELTEQVATATEQDERLDALSELSVRALETAADTPPAENESLLAIREVMAEADTPAVRAAASRHLGQLRDYDSLPMLIEGLTHESAEVRASAHAAIKEIVRFDSGFDAQSSPDGQAAAIAVYQRFWDGTKDSILGERLRDPAKMREHKAARADKIREAARERWEKIKAERAANAQG